MFFPRSTLVDRGKEVLWPRGKSSKYNTSLSIIPTVTESWSSFVDGCKEHHLSLILT